MSDQDMNYERYKAVVKATIQAYMDSQESFERARLKRLDREAELKKLLGLED